MSSQTVEVEGWGTTFDVNSGSDPSAGSWTTVTGEVVDIEVGDEECGDMPTHHLATAGHAKTYQAGMIEPGETKLTLNYSSSSYSAMKALHRVARAFRVNYSDAVTTTPSRMSFAGYVKKVAPKTIENDKIVTYEVTVKRSGPITFSTAS